MNVGKLLANCTVQKNLPLYKALVKFTLYYYWRLSGGWVSCGFIGHFWAVCHLVCHEKCHCCILAKEKMLLWVPHTFLWYWILEFIWNSFLIVCWLYVLSETIDTSFQGQLTCHFHSLEGLIIWAGFCLWFFFPFCHFITQEEGCLQVIKDTPFWYTVITFSADTAVFFDSIAGFAFRSGFFGFVSDGFCFACRLDGSRDTFFIWICKKQHI